MAFPAIRAQKRINMIMVPPNLPEISHGSIPYLVQKGYKETAFFKILEIKASQAANPPRKALFDDDRRPVFQPQVFGGQITKHLRCDLLDHFDELAE